MGEKPCWWQWCNVLSREVITARSLFLIKFIKCVHFWDVVSRIHCNKLAWRPSLRLHWQQSQVKVKVLHADLTWDCIGSQSSQGQGLACRPYLGLHWQPVKSRSCMKTLLGIALAASQVKVLHEDLAWDCIGSQSSQGQGDCF